MIISDPQNGGVASLLPKTLLAQVCVPYRVRPIRGNHGHTPLGKLGDSTSLSD